MADDFTKEIKSFCAKLSDRSLDGRIKPRIAAWSEPATALEVLEVLDLCINGSLCSSFELHLFNMLLSEACAREKCTRGDLEALAVWRQHL